MVGNLLNIIINHSIIIYIILSVNPIRYCCLNVRHNQTNNEIKNITIQLMLVFLNYTVEIYPTINRSEFYTHLSLPRDFFFEILLGDDFFDGDLSLLPALVSELLSFAPLPTEDTSKNNTE